MQVLVDAATRLVAAVGQPPPGHRNDGQAYTTSKVDRAVAQVSVLADGGYPGTGLLIPRCRTPGQPELPGWKDRDNTDHRRVHTRTEHSCAAEKTQKILRDRRRRGHRLY